MPYLVSYMKNENSVITWGSATCDELKPYNQMMKDFNAEGAAIISISKLTKKEKDTLVGKGGW